MNGALQAEDRRCALDRRFGLGRFVSSRLTVCMRDEAMQTGTAWAREPSCGKARVPIRGTNLSATQRNSNPASPRNTQETRSDLRLRRSTEPKATGSNPVGRVTETSAARRGGDEQ